MAKINITPAARELTEPHAAGGNVRAAERAAIAAAMPAYLARFSGFVPVYDMSGKPDNAAALVATAAREKRIAARNIAAAARNAAAREERMAQAARFADLHAVTVAADAADDDSEYDFENEDSEARMLHGDNVSMMLLKKAETARAQGLHDKASAASAYAFLAFLRERRATTNKDS